MKKILGVFVLAAVFPVLGCTAVTSLEPVGKDPVVIKDQDWEGAWYDGDETIYFVMVKDKDKGLLRVALVTPERDKEKHELDFSLHRFDVQLRQSKSMKFGNVGMVDMMGADKVDAPNKDSYLWFLFKKSGDNVVIYPPNDKFFEKLVEDGTLKGRRAKESIILTDSNARILEVLESYGDSATPYYWKETLMLRRIVP